jgi:hypothetical protein
VSVTLRHPFRLDAAGSVATVKQGTAAHAAETVTHVIACRIGERPLAPLWGLPDPLADGVDELDIRSAVDYCEPDIDVIAVDITGSPTGDSDISVDATWRSYA